MRYSSETLDLGGGWYLERKKIGATVYWHAMKLDAPGGYVVDRLQREFFTKRAALIWVRSKR